MSKESFKRFINDVQNEPVDDAETEKRMIELGCLSATELTKMEFLEYLSLSRYAALVKLDSASNVYHDMKRPICEYFINSSHNTYLTAGQLTGKSSTEMYKKALLDGCRCVELDCWNGPVREPIVYHGHTRTSKIRFVDCIKTIKEFAFVASPYPVILSLEVHTDLKQQDRMATILTKYLGDSLLKPTWQPNEAPDIDLSPESLKYKFLVKCKRGNFTIEAGMYKDEDDCDDADVDDEVYLTAKEERKSDKKESTSEFLSSLVTIESAGYKGTENLSYLSNRHPYHCTSLSEKKAKTVYEENPHAFTKINAACLTRIYPAGTRFDSSNYNPQGYWNCGCQIVALNWQSVKTFEWRHNKAFFMDNGNCGYLLKPPCLLPPFPTAERKSLTVEIISGFCLPKPKGNDKKSTLDPCVSLSVEGPGVDNTPHRTAIIKDNGFRPVWRGTGVNTFSWSIPNWDMSSIAIQVYDGNNLTTSGLVGERILLLRLISSGCRRMYLWNAKGVEVAGACVMCMISLT
ncbi:phospholipase C, delta [Angomonas deanei]|uniref:Phosphoinositide phospholipase C n=1 Tax=Angomonas deanei TaxID=59799 RepID=A0A7G2CCA4_9TRYP|nr:phospholipase C, delta [Angomonas deanei]CAD2216353.1 Phosphatidylinositol-specific phospholipase C, X domain/Phosphatidylinositol-specific phospholipase C, Y domain/C2 domain containing protein, putative [Angomonas deanei]|eukprot:EPY25037.1 phospholipase C, delta [Angomonas deanei]